MADDIFEEPHMRAGPSRSSPPEPRRVITTDPLEELAQHSVWDEPGAATALAGPPPADAVSYGTWLERAGEEARPWQTWFMVAAAVTCTVPMALIGAFSQPPMALPPVTVVSVVFVMPVLLECLKVGALAMALERRPNLFGETSLMVGAVACGLTYGLIEGAVHGALFSGAPPMGLVALAVHALSSGLFGVGLVRVWRTSQVERDRPRLRHAAAWCAAGVTVQIMFRLVALFVG